MPDSYGARKGGSGNLWNIEDAMIRMEKACELLKNTKLDIQTIVMQVGYFNVPSFNRLFKLKYGLSPGEYRMEDSRDIK